MKKCHSCGETKGLKAIQIPECDCGKCDGFYHNKSVCKNCYFTEETSCELDGHSVLTCLEDENCQNNKDNTALKENWDDFDYRYRPKKVIA